MTHGPHDTELEFFATAAKGAEELLADELRTLAADQRTGDATVARERGGVSFEGPLALGYRACLWSRFAQRVLLRVASVPLAGGADAFWSGLAEIDWAAHLSPDGTLAVEFAGLGAAVGVTNTLFGAQRTKDVIVDQLRMRFDRRPSVDLARPDLRVNVYVGRREAVVAVDLSGESLHRRGYRAPGEQVAAPLKETLAAAILVRAGWPAIAAAGGSVVDPLCGSGTLPIEAAMIAADLAPGLLREAAAPSGRRWGFTGWLGHDARVWETLVAEAGERRAAALARLRTARAPALSSHAAEVGAVPVAFGYDRDARAVALAQADVERAGLGELVRIERRELAGLVRPAGIASAAPGLVVANPPYGHRLTSGNKAATPVAVDPGLAALYELLGERLRTQFAGWKAAVLVNDLELGKHLGLRARRANRFMNGPLPCTLLRIEIDGRASVPRGPVGVEPASRGGAEPSSRGGAEPSSRGGAEPSSRGGAEPSSRGGAEPSSRGGAEPSSRGGAEPSSRGGAEPSSRGGAEPSSRGGALPPWPIGPDVGQLAKVAKTPQASSPNRAASVAGALSPAAEQFANRLRKNARRWRRYMRRAGVTCYRVYDADLPDYALAIDIYERWVHVQEYAPPPEIDEAKAAARLVEAMRVIPEVLDAAPDDVFLKVRARQRGATQYARRAATGVEHEVHERELSFLVNFSDYLDTGLFLPGREVRHLLAGLATGQRFLNLFGYTGTASVAAGKGGATSTTTVDLNGRYLEWARRNFAVNKLKDACNAVVEADVLQWVARTDLRFGLIYLDPPTFSNSKKMGRAIFEVRRDHADLIRLVVRRLLEPGGVLVFACNARKFAFDAGALAHDHDLEDLSKATLPPDFARSARAHHVWRISARE